jgi:RimJ/RimL family protein N-acetyltransferase
VSPRRAPRGRPVLTTGRLVLRPLSWDDLPELEALDADPEVMRFLDRPRTPAEVRERMLSRLDPTADAMGLGYWAGLERGRFVGWWLLSPQGPGLAEIGWRLHPRAWGRGLASEGAAALLEHGFTAVGLDRVVAETMVVNQASRGVMRRIGMRPAGVVHRAPASPLPGADEGEWLAELTAHDWREATNG